jgi:hypothetical protein
VKIKVLKLSTVCRDKATELTGTLTHWSCDLSRSIHYLFQPKGLDDFGRPVKKICLEAQRLEVKASDYEEVEVPFEILETRVTNNASGFTGMAVRFVYHINGCFHVCIQPKGICQKTKVPFEPDEFDLRECTGEMITKLSKKALAESKKINPSPTGDTFPEFISEGRRESVPGSFLRQ